VAERDEVVVVELDAPALVRGVLRDDLATHGVADRGLLPGISMVEKPKRTGWPVVGCCQVRAANASISDFSSPLPGGAASIWPMTEKRQCAHRSCTRVGTAPGAPLLGCPHLP
jgi:hypothetical protein